MKSLDMMGCVLEYLYTREYYLQKIVGHWRLAHNPTLPKVDETGKQLLKHTRIYILADKLGMGILKMFAHSKIHCVNPNTKGEIAYTRYMC